jgi:hypothetical protein
MFWHALILFGATLGGIYLACHLFRYELSDARKVAAAAVFLVLNFIPIIPLIMFPLSLVGLYMAMQGEPDQRGELRQVFLLTVAFAAAAVLLVYAIKGSA